MNNSEVHTVANIRTFLGWDKNYSLINREERNLAAIFYHFLLQEGNLQKFLNYIECKSKIIPAEMGIYFEYAYIRDLWSELTKNKKNRDENNKKGKELILKLLKPANQDELTNKTPLDFNKYFGAVPKPSEEYIQSPGNWSLTRYAENIKDPEEFLKTCKFKWAFNAKPDIVIHTSKDEAICIEAKLESGEGSYPQNEHEKDIFKNKTNGKDYVTQTELQRYLMKCLLGINTQFIFLAKKDGRRTSKNSDQDTKLLLWKDVFQLFDLTNTPPFIKETIKRCL